MSRDEVVPIQYITQHGIEGVNCLTSGPPQIADCRPR